MQLGTLHDLYMNELNDLHSAENQLLKALPKMAAAASNAELRAAFDDHLEETRGQVDRLGIIFTSLLAARPNGKTCKPIEELIEQGQGIIGRDAEPAVLNAALIATAQRIEHYEIAGYGSAQTLPPCLVTTKHPTCSSKRLERKTPRTRG